MPAQVLSQAVRTAKKEAAPAKPKKPNAAAQSKRLKKQLEGLDMAEIIVEWRKMSTRRASA